MIILEHKCTSFVEIDQSDGPIYTALSRKDIFLTSVYFCAKVHCDNCINPSKHFLAPSLTFKW